LRNAFLPDGEIADVVIDGERIAVIGPGVAAEIPQAIDCSGKLVLPAFVDGHVHLDKVLIRDELREHDGTLTGAIQAIHERKRRYTVEDVRERARSVIEAGARSVAVIGDLLATGHPTKRVEQLLRALGETR